MIPIYFTSLIFFNHFLSLIYDPAFLTTSTCFVTFVNISHYSCHCLLVHPENCPLLGSFPIRGKCVFSQIFSHLTSLGWGWPHNRKFTASFPVLMLLSHPKGQWCPMMIGGEHSTTYKEVESLCHTHETIVISCLNSTQIKKIKEKTKNPQRDKLEKSHLLRTRALTISHGKNLPLHL